MKAITTTIQIELSGELREAIRQYALDNGLDIQTAIQECLEWFFINSNRKG